MVDNPQIAPSPRTGLVLAGGGARGAYQVGVVRAIAEVNGTRPNPFSIITGVSVGSINAVAIAGEAGNFRRAARNLEHLWRQLTTGRVYDASTAAVAVTSMKWFFALVFGGLGVGDPVALLDNTPLRRLLETTFDPEGIAKELQNGSLDALAVTVAGYTDGHAITHFQAGDGVEEWNRIRRDGVRSVVGIDHLMASASLPFIFPAVRIGSQYCGDGSMRLSAPLSPAIRMGANKIVVVGVRDKVSPPAGDAAVEPQYPSIGDMGGYALDILFNDNLDADIERLTRINHTLDLIPESRRRESGFRRIDILTLFPSQDLRTVAARHADEMPRTIRLLLRTLGNWGRGDRLPSYLMFEPGYLHALIDLGFADTMAQRGEIERFLGIDPQPQASHVPRRRAE